MATINGIGTLRYDWQKRGDGTADATVWFVILLLPALPIRREHVKVHKGAPIPAGFLDHIGAMIGFGSGFHSHIEVLGRSPLKLLRVLRTYFLGFVVVPLICLSPALLLTGMMVALIETNVIEKKAFEYVIPFFGIVPFVWSACVVAKILDRSVGRHHYFDENESHEGDGSHDEYDEDFDDEWNTSTGFPPSRE